MSKDRYNVSTLKFITPDVSESIHNGILYHSIGLHPADAKFCDDFMKEPAVMRTLRNAPNYTGQERDHRYENGLTCEIAIGRWLKAMEKPAEWLTKPNGKGNNGDFRIAEGLLEVKKTPWEYFLFLEAQLKRQIERNQLADIYVGVDAKYDSIVGYIRGFFTRDQLLAMPIAEPGMILESISGNWPKITLDNRYRFSPYLKEQNYSQLKKKLDIIKGRFDDGSE